MLLGSSRRGFGYRRQLHVWLTPGDYENASLMILLAYILLGHPDWKGGVIKVFSILHAERLDEERERLYRLIRSGRLPISASNVELIPAGGGEGPSGDRERPLARRRPRHPRASGARRSAGAGPRSSRGTKASGNVLFVNTKKEIEIVKEGDEPAGGRAPEEDVPEGAPPPP